MNGAATHTLAAVVSAKCERVCATRHKRGHFFMSNLNEVEHIDGAIQRAQDVVYAITRKTVNAFDSPLGEAFKEEIADFIFHLQLRLMIK